MQNLNARGTNMSPVHFYSLVVYEIQKKYQRAVYDVIVPPPSRPPPSPEHLLVEETQYVQAVSMEKNAVRVQYMHAQLRRYST